MSDFARRQHPSSGFLGRLREDAAVARTIAGMMSLRDDRERLMAQARKLEAWANALENGVKAQAADEPLMLPTQGRPPYLPSQQLLEHRQERPWQRPAGGRATGMGGGPA